MQVTQTHTPAGVGILHQDERFLVLNKPAGILTTGDGREPTLAAAAKQYDSEAPHLHPTSRLDRGVSGVVVFARTRAANREVLMARKRHCYRRQYLAIVSGAPDEACGTWRWPIALSSVDRRRRIVPVAGGDSGIGSRPAVTDYMQVAATGSVSLLSLAPRTGRTHQLRVHAAQAAVPLVGDKHYGVADIVQPNGRVIRPDRVLLHCYRVQIELGETDRLRVQAQVPDDFANVWRQCGGEAIETLVGQWEWPPDLDLDGPSPAGDSGRP